MEESRLFVLPVESMNLTAAWREHEGWCIRFASRHQGDSWANVRWTEYAGLSTQEAMDVICCEAAGRLLDS